MTGEDILAPPKNLRAVLRNMSLEMTWDAACPDEVKFKHRYLVIIIIKFICDLNDLFFSIFKVKVSFIDELCNANRI